MLGAVISTVQSPSGPSLASPSNFIDAWGLIHRNCVIVPSMRTTRVLSKAVVEWWVLAGIAQSSAAAAKVVTPALRIVLMSDS